eukprot:symbB.v1.2.016982.t1/scaffold1297.1/size126219/6
MLITILLCLNVLWMGLELQYSGSWTGVQLGIFQGTMVPEDWRPTVDTIFLVGDAIFTGLFTIDVVVRIVVLKLKFWKYCMNYVDVIVTLATLLQLVISTWTSVNPVLFRILRIGKLARALRVVTMSNTLASLELLTKCLQSSVDMLFWSFCLLTGIQCVAGMVVSALSREFIEDESQDPSVREAVFRYYGTFTRTFLSMFEILFANWGPPCRIVVENISEWFSVFFLLYRCVLGFAVLNVVNAVFVQQTMKTATSDEELAFKQKEREMAMYTRKVRKLFNSMDETGDGCLNLEEFQKLAQSPKLKFWMSQLELEYHDLLSLFEFLDNGDGEITPAEFIEGASRLRGSAKAVDIWRLETKVEVLMGEVLKTLSANEGEDPGVSHVQTVFNRSHYQHIHSIAKESKGPLPTPAVKPASPSEDHAEPQEELGGREICNFIGMLEGVMTDTTHDWRRERQRGASPWAELLVLDPTREGTESLSLVPRLHPATQLLLGHELQRAHQRIEAHGDLEDAFASVPEGINALPSFIQEFPRVAGWPANV